MAKRKDDTPSGDGYQQLSTLEEVLAEDLADPAFRDEWARRRLIADVAIAVKGIARTRGDERPRNMPRAIPPNAAWESPSPR